MSSLKENVEKLGVIATVNIIQFLFQLNAEANQTISDLSANLANIVYEEHSILDNPLIAPPLSFPRQLYKLERLNLNAQTSIILAQEARKDYEATVREMRKTLEKTEQDMLDRAVRLRSSSEAVFSKISRQTRTTTESNDQQYEQEESWEQFELDEVFN